MVYGRYNDIIYQVISFYILIRLYQDRIKIGKVTSNILITFIIGAAIYLQLHALKLSSDGFMLVNVPSLILFNGSWTKNVRLIPLTFLAVFLFILLVVGEKAAEKSKKKIFGAFMLVSVCISILSASSFHKKVTINEWENVLVGYNSFLKQIRSDNTANKKIYYIGPQIPMAISQMCLPRQSLIWVKPGSNMPKDKDAYYIIAGNKDWYNEGTSCLKTISRVPYAIICMIKK
jgi:multisubunit Na+/H+ antiporter MnhB subunit